MKSHAFDKAIIYCYNNLFKYHWIETDDYLIVNQQKRDTIFLYNPNYDYKTLSSRNSIVVYCETQIPDSKCVNETAYELEKIFTNPTKQIRRAMNFKRDNVQFLNKEINEGDRVKVFNEWKEYKNERVFRITFSPERYLRSYSLDKVKDLNIYEKIIYVNQKPYAVINFDLHDNMAFEISFVSKFFDKELRFINDLNECILLNCFYDLYLNYKIKNINVGPDAGIKGLKFFKNQIPFFQNKIYSLTIKTQPLKLL